MLPTNHTHAKGPMRAPMRYHHQLYTGLLAMGYRREVASCIATYYLMGKTLFPNEYGDALAVMKTVSPVGKA